MFTHYTLGVEHVVAASRLSEGSIAVLCAFSCIGGNVSSKPILKHGAHLAHMHPLITGALHEEVYGVLSSLWAEGSI